MGWPTPVVGDTNLAQVQAGTLLWRGHRYSAPAGMSSSGGYATTLRSGGLGYNWNTLTLAALVHITTTGSTAGLYVASMTGGSYAAPAFLHDGGVGTNEFHLSIRQGDGQFKSVPTGDTTLKARFAVARLRSDDRMELWVDGIYVGQTAIARNTYTTAYTQATYLTNAYATYSRCAVAYVWDRWISDSEVLALSRDPFMVFADPDPLTGIDAQIVGSYQYARPSSDLVTSGWSVV
jgi:hypothetical protein